MRTLLQINSVAGYGSTGKIADQIGQLAINNGWSSHIAFGRKKGKSSSNLWRIGSTTSVYLHGFESLMLNRHGLASRTETRNFLRTVETQIKPDLIHLHNLHGYYLNYPVLFKWLKEWGGPVVWTLHDIWPLTGHCALFGQKECDNLSTGCKKCGYKHSYPRTLTSICTSRNFDLKKKIFTSLTNLTLVPVSNWLDSMVQQSPLSKFNSIVIHNGININTFKPLYNQANTKPYILGVANVWLKSKGLYDFFELRKILPKNIGITLVGLTQKQINSLPQGITGITRTQNQTELAQIYSNAIALINPTYADSYPTVNLEAMACGTPVITYKTGGSPEPIVHGTGAVVEKGDIQALAENIANINNIADREKCRSNAVTNFNNHSCFEKYIALYNHLIQP